MRTYELALVFKSALAEKDRTKLLDTVKKWLGDVKVAKEDDLGQKPLAYPIKHETAGYYVMYNLETEGAIPADFETKLLREENILRHLLVRGK